MTYFFITYTYLVVYVINKTVWDSGKVRLHVDFLRDIDLILLKVKLKKGKMTDWELCLKKI